MLTIGILNAFVKPGALPVIEFDGEGVPIDAYSLYNDLILPEFPAYQKILKKYFDMPESKAFIFYCLDYLALEGKRYDPKIFAQLDLHGYGSLFFQEHALFQKPDET